MIRPTLFIGLGTTGTKILKSIRQLMSEEYGHAGLPIFRYIAIETDSAVDVGNTNQMEDYEQINLVVASIGSFAPTQNKLNPAHPNYDPHLVDWLNPRLLKFAGAFKAGAANIRMAGRLCLWENWERMRATLDQAYGAILAPGATTETQKILGYPLGADGTINVYVVGSLCGGSCSGMLVDIGYFCQELLEASDKVYGIFTMYDKNLATGPAAATAVQSANCYASLQEINYYNHIETIYEVTPPSGMPIRSGVPPYDYTMLISRSGVNGTYKFVTDGGLFDEDGLNLMVALNIFADTAGDTDGKKEAIRINFLGFPDFGTLKKVPTGQIATMMKVMASFGLTAVWYPKYRIASASASLISNKLCDNWSTAHTPQATIVEMAKQEWNTILNQNIEILTSPDGQPSIRNRIASHLGQARQQWSRPEVSADLLRRSMPAFPSSEPFREKFESGGEYAELMKMQVSECKKGFHNAIEQVLNNQLARVNFKGTYGLGDVQAFFEAFDSEIEDIIGKCPDQMPTLDLKSLDFNSMLSAESNRWTKFIGLQSQSAAAHRNALIDNYCALISESPGSIYVTLRNYFLGPVLQAVREELGFGVKPMNIGPIRQQTVKQRLDEISANLKGCVHEFTEDYKDAIDPQASECVRIVTNNPENRIDTDAEHLSYQIALKDGGVALLDGKTMSEFLSGSQADITAQMTETYRRLSMSQIQGQDVAKKAQAILNDAGSDNIQTLANRSNPYQMFIDGFQSFATGKPTKIIFGHDSTNKVLGDLQLKLGFPDKGSSSVEHLLFFYEEEAGFTVDDLDSYETLKKRFDETPGPFGHSTHQDSDFYDLELYHKTERLNWWCRALARLVPTICNRINDEAFAGLFRFDSGIYVFEYLVDGLPQTLSLFGDADGIKTLSQKENEDAYSEFIKSIHSTFASLDRETVNSVVTNLLQEVPNTDDRNTLSEFYRHFLADVYRDPGFKLSPLSDEVKALDEFFFQSISETPQNTANTQWSHPRSEDADPPRSSGGEGRATPRENVTNTDTSAETGSYDEIDSEDAESGTVPFTETASESSVGYNEETIGADETDIVSEDSMSQDSTADANQENVVWIEATSEDELAEEAPVEEISINQESQPERTPATDAQKKQANTSKEFSVADVDPEMLRNTRNTRKKG